MAPALVLPVLVALAGADAAVLAVLPVSGEATATADPKLLADIDAHLRRGVAARKELSLQKRDDTVAQLRGADPQTLACGMDDFACLRGVAVLVGADLLLVPEVVPDGRGVELELVLVAVREEALVRRKVIVAQRGRAADAFVEALVDDVLTARRVRVPPPAPPPPSTPPVLAAAATPPVSASGAAGTPAVPENEKQEPEPGAQEEGTPGWVIAAGVAAAIVGAVAIAAGVGVAVFVATR